MTATSEDDLYFEMEFGGDKEVLSGWRVKLKLFMRVQDKEMPRKCIYTFAM